MCIRYLHEVPNIEMGEGGGNNRYEYVFIPKFFWDSATVVMNFGQFCK